MIEDLVAPFRSVEPPAPREETGFFTDTTLCIGCKACEVACKQWNQLPADGLSFTGNSYDNTSRLSATTWRHVAFVEQLGSEPPRPDRWLMMSDVCKHCVEAPCQQACPTGALIYNEFGNVYVQPDICNGCGYCVVSCPFGVIDRSEDDGRAHKCTLCYDRQRDDMEPACAKACPTDSIQFGKVADLRAVARERVATLHERGEASAYLYGADATNQYEPLNAFFLLTDRPSAYNLPETPRRPIRNMKPSYLFGFGAAAALAAFSALVFGRRGAR